MTPTPGRHSEVLSYLHHQRLGRSRKRPPVWVWAASGIDVMRLAPSPRRSGRAWPSLECDANGLADQRFNLTSARPAKDLSRSLE